MKGLSAEQMKEWERLQGAATEALESCAAFRDGLIEEMDTFYETRSEKWQEGEKGEQFQSWKSAWEDFDFAEAIDNLNALPCTAEDVSFTPAQRWRHRRRTRESATQGD